MVKNRIDVRRERMIDAVLLFAAGASFLVGMTIALSPLIG